MKETSDYWVKNAFLIAYGLRIQNLQNKLKTTNEFLRKTYQKQLDKAIEDYEEMWIDRYHEDLMIKWLEHKADDWHPVLDDDIEPNDEFFEYALERCREVNAEVLDLKQIA